MNCQLLHEQVREKTDKFQQRRLDGFFKAGAKAADEGDTVEEAEPPAMPEVMAMEVEMEVCTPHGSIQCRHTVPFTSDPAIRSLQTCCSFLCRLNVPLSADAVVLSMQSIVPFNAGPVSFLSSFPHVPVFQ